MTVRSSSSPSPARRSAGSTRRWGPAPLLVVALAAVILAGLAALVVTLVGESEASQTSFDTAAASVEGAALPPLPETGTDPAVGDRAPVLEGIDLDGEAGRYPVEGRPAVLVFLAHWCPHCRAEVPVVQEWVDAGNLPEDVDLVGVATAIDQARPNHPPSAWLEREGWSSATVADAGNVTGEAFGLTAFPFWVAVDADGRVVERRVGELTPTQLTELVRRAAPARG